MQVPSKLLVYILVNVNSDTSRKNGRFNLEVRREHERIISVNSAVRMCDVHKF